jgi:TonB family protein
MPRKEKFGKFILFEELDSGGLGTEYRAAKLGPTGLEKIVSVLRLSPAVSANVEVAKAVMDQAKVAAQLQNPNITRIYGIGKVESAYYVSTEFIEGKNLKQVFDRCRRDAFPFSIDHGLLIASKVCTALEYSHGRKIDPGVRYFHGLLSARNVLVSYEGEVRVRGFGNWLARVRDTSALQEEDLRYLAPEQEAGSGDFRSDVYAVGAILWETLTGKPYADPGASGDVAARIASARLQAPTGDDDKIPKPIAEILTRALAVDPGARYAEIQEMRKGIDTLLFSGDFTPTTFNLAFFMHSVFRDDIERESKELKEEREANYAEFLTEAGPKTPAAAPLTTPVPSASRPRADVQHTPIPTPREQHHTPVPVPSPPEPHATPPAVGTSPKQAAAGFTFHKEAPPKSRTPLLALVGLLVVVLVGAGYWYFSMGPGAHKAPPAPTTTTLSPQAVAALAKVKELEDKLKAIEDEKAAAEQKAQEEAAAKLQKEAKARGGEVDAGALQKAKEDAARQARAEQERKQQEEKKRLEQEKAAEEARVADEQRKAEEAARQAAATSTTTTTLPPTTTTTLPPLRPGALVNLSDAGVIPPVLDKEKTQPLFYPQLALRSRVEGTVDLTALVDENGNVIDAKIVKEAGGKWGLNEAALDHVKNRHYRPATKDGIPVKVWIAVRVPFKLPS